MRNREIEREREGRTHRQKDRRTDRDTGRQILVIERKQEEERK